MIGRQMNVYLRKPTTYTVIWKAQGEILKTEEVEIDNDATPPEVNIGGYTFKGWDKSYKGITQNMEIHAILEIKTYTVRWLVNGEVKKQITANYMQTVLTAEQAPTVTIEGYTVTWQASTIFVMNDIDINAILTPVMCKVTWSVYGTWVKHEQVQYGQSATPPTEAEINAAMPSDGKFISWDRDYSVILYDVEINAVVGRDWMFNAGGSSYESITAKTVLFPNQNYWSYSVLLVEKESYNRIYNNDNNTTYTLSDNSLCRIDLSKGSIAIIPYKEGTGTLEVTCNGYTHSLTITTYMLNIPETIAISVTEGEIISSIEKSSEYISLYYTNGTFYDKSSSISTTVESISNISIGDKSTLLDINRNLINNMAIRSGNAVIERSFKDAFGTIYKQKKIYTIIKNENWAIMNSSKTSQIYYATISVGSSLNIATKAYLQMNGVKSWYYSDVMPWNSQQTEVAQCVWVSDTSEWDENGRKYNQKIAKLSYPTKTSIAITGLQKGICVFSLVTNGGYPKNEKGFVVIKVV